VEALRSNFRPIISPAFELEGIPAPESDFEAAIFTSMAGVAHAPRGAGRTAWCVGDTTAQAAERAGYVAISAAGSAEDLVALILKQKPQSRLAYFRGEVSKKNISAALNAAGLNCHDQIVYRKAPCVPTPEAIVALDGAREIIVPLFSAETVSILANWRLDFSRCHIVAMSSAVSDAAQVLRPRSVVIAAHPDQDTMAHTLVGLIA
ncbi:MAG: uroporphyrinogen-III synthase, partial [Octadecabacter sp.]|nr:uroporphyrinogen-III synthase [Octadecabacter sp.]